MDQEPYVLPERPVGHVQVGQLEHLLEGDVGAPQDLPEAGDAWSQVEPSPPPAGDLLVESRGHRPRPHEAHVAADDVPELRQLVEAGAPEDPAYLRDPRVVVE